MSAVPLTEPWPRALGRILAREPCVVVCIAAIKGSAPRELGARMLVTAKGVMGSIGGGNLEFQALVRARELLGDDEAPTMQSERVGLGPALNQCCGGAVTLLFERHQPPAPGWLVELERRTDAGENPVLVTTLGPGEPARRLLAGGGDERLELAVKTCGDELPPEGGAILHVSDEHGELLLERPGGRRLPLTLFGAGHVGRAVVRVLGDLPFDITWVDSRADEFPASVPDGVNTVVAADPVTAARACPPGGLVLVMTHSHQLDEDLCHALLREDRCRWLGLIGSRTKRMRFEHRLRDRGLDATALERLVCPVGDAGVRGKRPATIAIAVAAQLLAEQVPTGLR